METSEGKRVSARQRIEIKFSEQQKAAISRAAAISKKSLAEFVRDAAERAATEIVAKNPT